jgi:hypothetical protein
MILFRSSLTKKKPCHAPRGYGLFCFHSSASQAGVGLKTKNPGALRQGFFFVAEYDQISNLHLIREIDRIIEMEEILSSTLYRFDQVITKPKHKCKVQNYNAPSHIIHQPF